MKFIIDAQLPRRLSHWINDQGYHSIHTLDLPDENLTHDSTIISISMEQKRIVISKDSDFYEQYIVNGKPHKLLIITTGNIVNKKLIELFEINFKNICKILKENKVVELNNTDLIIHI